MFTIDVLWGFRDEAELVENGADMVVKKPSELYEFVREEKTEGRIHYYKDDTDNLDV